MKRTAIKKLSAFLALAVFSGMIACDSNNSESSNYHGNDAGADSAMNQSDTRTGMSDDEGTNALDEGNAASPTDPAESPSTGATGTGPSGEAIDTAGNRPN